MKSILITGCSSGIGLSAAKILKGRGYRVLATARKESDVATLAEQGFEAYVLNLQDSTSITAAVRWATQLTNGKIDALFNNGAYGQPGAVEDLSRDVLREQFETNLFGTHELTCHVIRLMRQQGHGRIIQNSSVLGLITLKYRGAYNASKFALEGLTDTLRQELHGSGIHISLIEPGPITSRFRENAYQAFLKNINQEQSPHSEVYAAVTSRLGKTTATREKDPFTLGPEAVVDKLIHAIESSRPKARYYVTFPTWLFGFLRRVLPTSLLDKILIRISNDENK